MRRWRAQRVAFLGFLSLAVWMGILPGSSQGGETLKVGFPSLTMSTILPHIAQDLGYLEGEGVSVEIKHFESGSINMKALLARAVDLSDVETAAILAAAASGADLRIFGTHEWGLHFALYAARDIKVLRDLYGKRFAISGIGGLPHVVILALLGGQNLEPEKVQMVVVGGQVARLKALMAGKVDATVGEARPEVEADPKLHRLFVVPDKLPQYLSQSLAAYADTLAARQDAVARFQRGLVKAARFAYRNKEAFVRAAAKHLPGTPEELGKIYDFYYQVRHWSINGEVPLERIKYMQDLGLETKTQSRPVDLNRLVDPAFAGRALAGLGRLEFP